MELFFPFEAMGKIGRYATMGYTVAWVPAGLLKQMPVRPASRPRVVGEMAGIPFKGALQPTSDGRAYFIFNKALQKRSGLGEDDPVSLAFRLDDPDAVDVPPELEEALAEDAGAREIWDGLTAGTRRGFSHRVSSAKAQTTRRKRVAEVLMALEAPNPSPYPTRRR